MKTTLSILDRVNRRVRAVRMELKLIWILVVKYERAKSQEVLLSCFWYDYLHIRRIKPNWIIENFLDTRVEDLKRVVADVEGSARKRQLNKDLLDALCDKTARGVILDYLKGPSPENYEPAVVAIRSLWRTDERAVLAEPVGNVASSERLERTAIVDPVESDVNENVKPLNAKTYIIAVHLRLELEGREAEFDSLSRRLPKLMSFIRAQFQVDKLPARLEDFKGYSYKPILEQKTGAKKGQLRPPFRQIAQHPEIFGKKVAAMAQRILDEKFG
jgi:hypothetical protein